MTTDKGLHPANPQAGKALVYFLQDDLHFDSRPRRTTLFGIDGNWVGATHANSYFFVYLDPGDHHLCSEWQMDVAPTHHKRSKAALHFTAESSKTYYFRAKDIAIKELVGVELEAMDSDEAQLVMSSFEYSQSHPRN